jgi:mevalonate kinase
MTHFRANGKLLLTAEYTVLRGALALALPTRQGQTLQISPSGDTLMHWQSKAQDGSIWFEATFASDFSVLKTSDHSVAKRLVAILKMAAELNTGFNPFGSAAVTQLEFNRAWGLGSSSTLVALIAQWAQVDALQLFFKTQTGSGYDVAAAQSDAPLLYRLVEDGLAEVSATKFRPPFARDLAFVYLGQKQQSDKEVARFADCETSTEQLEAISAITQKIIACQTLAEFEKLLREHEHITGEIISQQPVQQRLFADYPGVVKSLGAWGGDFVLATQLDHAKVYFPQAGYATVLGWDDLFDF